MQIYTGAGTVIALCTGRPGITFSVNKRTLLRSKAGLLSIIYVVVVAFLLTLCAIHAVLKLSGYGDDGRVFNSCWVYGLLSHLSCLHRRPFLTDFMQFLSGLKFISAVCWRWTNRTVQWRLSYTCILIFKTWSSDTSSNWHLRLSPESSGSPIEEAVWISHFFLLLDRIHILVGCRSERGKGW